MQYLKIVLLVSIGITIAFANAYAQNDVIISPLKQIKLGILPQDVKCKVDFVLIINEKNSVPICVRPATSQKLLERGWVTPEKFESMHQIINHYNNETNNLPIQKQISANSNTTTNNEISINNATKIISTNSTISAINTSSIINTTSNVKKSYENSNGSMSHVAYNWITPLPAIQVTPIVSSTQPNSIRILSIGMSPNPLKVGDKPQFTLTYQNISDKPVYVRFGCTVTPLGLTISPSDNVVGGIGANLAACPDEGPAPIYPTQINTNVAWFDPTYGHLNTDAMTPAFTYGFYQIIKAGMLHVTMILYLQNEQGEYDFVERVQFNVNATQ